MPVKNLVYILLGGDCNFNCRYCMNHGAPANRVSPDFRALFTQIDGVLAEDHPVHIRFFGGEPLMYWDFIKKIMHRYKDIPNLSFDFPTNGSLFSLQHAQFLNLFNNFTLVLSHDGENTKQTRGIDVLKQPEKVRLFSSVPSLQFLSVINKYNPSIVKCWDYHAEVMGRECFSFPVPVFPTFDGFPADILDIDYSLVQNTSKHIAKSDGWREQRVVSHLIYKYILAVENHSLHTSCACNKLCHNYHFDLGGRRLDCCTGGVEITDFQIKRLEKQHSERLLRLNCVECSCYELCRGNCDLVVPSLQSRSCQLMRSFYTPLMEVVIHGC